MCVDICVTLSFFLSFPHLHPLLSPFAIPRPPLVFPLLVSRAPLKVRLLSQTVSTVALILFYRLAGSQHLARDAQAYRYLKL